MTKNNIYFYNKTNGSQDSSTRRPTKDHLQLEDPIRIREVQNIGIQLLEKNEKQLKYATWVERNRRAKREHKERLSREYTSPLSTVANILILLQTIQKCD